LQLAFKELAPQATPRPVAAFKDLTVDRVACGSVHTMVIANGKLYAFGSDSFGQTGLGTGANANPASVLPTLCTLYISKVVCGAYFTMVLTEDGQVYAFGTALPVPVPPPLSFSNVFLPAKVKIIMDRYLEFHKVKFVPRDQYSKILFLISCSSV
jgi:hypothetical protein